MYESKYDASANALYLRIAPEGVKVKGAKRVGHGVHLHLSEDGKLVGIEVLNVQSRDPGPETREVSLPVSTVKSAVKNPVEEPG